MKKVGISFLIAVFLMNSMSLSVWAMEVEKAVDNQEIENQIQDEEEILESDEQISEENEVSVDDVDSGSLNEESTEEMLSEEEEIAEEEIVEEVKEENLEKIEEESEISDEEEVLEEENESEDNNEGEVEENETVIGEEVEEKVVIDGELVEEDENEQSEEIVETEKSEEVSEQIIEIVLENNLIVEEFDNIEKGELQQVEIEKESVVVESKVFNGDFSDDIVINEIMVDSSDNNKEWVELYNKGDKDVDLTGWTIDDANDFNQPKNLVFDEDNSVILAGGFYIFGFDPNTDKFLTGWLNNDPSANETVTIFDPNGDPVDHVKVETADGEYPGEDETVGRFKDGEDNWVLFDIAEVTNGFSNVPPIPTQTGYNEDNGDDFATPRNPNEIVCKSGATNINGVSVHWTDVITGDDNEANLKYQRQYSLDGVNWNGSEIYTNPYTNYRTFGGGNGNEGIYYSRVRTFVDVDSNNQFDAGETVSDWSNVCDITYDVTVPDAFNISPEDEFITNGLSITQEWGSNADDVDYYIYESYNDELGVDLRYTQNFTATIKTINNIESTEFWWRIKAVDYAGNESEWSDLWKITVDNIAPVVTINYLATNDSTPKLTGLVDDVDAVVLVNINEVDYLATNNGDGTWILPDNIINPDLADSVYNVVVTATDKVNNKGYDVTVDELIVDATVPILTEVIPIDSPTNDNTPEYIFNSDEKGVFTYGGSCSSLTTEAIAGDNIISFEELTNGIYSDCTIVVTDNFGNKSEVLNVSEFVVDTEKPTVNQLDDQNFNEGDDVPLVDVNGKDNFEIEKFCFSVEKENEEEFVAETCNSEGGNVEYKWSTSFGLLSLFDTSMMPEGVYTINYYVEDLAGNRSDEYSVKYVLNNVAPSVEFTASDNDIDEDDKIYFSGSFTDPSSRDAGDGIFDDADWYAYINYGEGEDIYLGAFSNESLISISDHKYEHDGNFIAKLTVCESADNLSSENNCTVKEIAIEVDDEDSDEEEEEKIDEKVHDYFVPFYDNNFFETIVEQKDEVEKIQEEKVSVANIENELESEEGFVAGEQMCQDKWPMWVWIFLLIAFVGLNSLIGYSAKVKEVKISSVFWQVALMVVVFMIWYFVDVCRTCVWFPILVIVSGVAIAMIFYKSEEQS